MQVGFRNDQGRSSDARVNCHKTLTGRDMAKRVDKSTRALYTEAIRLNIANKDWTKLLDVMMEAETAGVGKSLRKRGWYHVGLYEAERGNHPAAIIALNSARMLDPVSGSTLSRMFEEIEAFCQDFEGRFSRQDLHMLTSSLERIASFYSFHLKIPKAVRDKEKRLAHWIAVQFSTAPDKEETPASHYVQLICAALYPPMTIEEVRAEFARIVEPLIRERLERGAKAASGDGGKGPKDPDDEGTEPPEKKPKSKK